MEWSKLDSAIWEHEARILRWFIGAATLALKVLTAIFLLFFG